MRVGALAALLVALLLGGFWLIHDRLSHPAGEPPKETPQLIFAYGTLTHPLIRRVVTGRWLPTQAAVLEGYRKEGLDIRPDPSSVVTGVVFEVQGRQLQRLDRYEQVGVRYDRHRVTLQSGQRAWVYRRIHETDEDE